MDELMREVERLHAEWLRRREFVNIEDAVNSAAVVISKQEELIRALRSELETPPNGRIFGIEVRTSRWLPPDMMLVVGPARCPQHRGSETADPLTCPDCLAQPGNVLIKGVR